MWNFGIYIFLLSPFIRFIIHSSSSETFLLVDEVGIEVVSSVFGRFTEVDEWGVPFLLVDDVIEEQVQGSLFLPLF